MTTQPLELVERELVQGGTLLRLVRNPQHTCPTPDKRQRRKIGMTFGTIWQCECGKTWTWAWRPNGWTWSGSDTAWIDGEGGCHSDGFPLHDPGGLWYTRPRA